MEITSRKADTFYTGDERDEVWGELFRPWTYVALSAAIEEGLQSFCWYQRFILPGARQHELPEEYVRLLASFDSSSDPDLARQRANELILG